jgi:hypothetical protein
VPLLSCHALLFSFCYNRSISSNNEEDSATSSHDRNSSSPHAMDISPVSLLPPRTTDPISQASPSFSKSFFSQLTANQPRSTLPLPRALPTSTPRPDQESVTTEDELPPAQDETDETGKATVHELPQALRVFGAELSTNAAARPLPKHNRAKSDGSTRLSDSKSFKRKADRQRPPPMPLLPPATTQDSAYMRFLYLLTCRLGR